MHSVLQTSDGKGILVENITVIYCKNDMTFGTITDVVVENYKIKTTGDYNYGIRAYANVHMLYTHPATF